MTLANRTNHEKTATPEVLQFLNRLQRQVSDLSEKAIEEIRELVSDGNLVVWDRDYVESLLRGTDYVEVKINGEPHRLVIELYPNQEKVLCYVGGAFSKNIRVCDAESAEVRDKDGRLLCGWGLLE